jgi:hypothetical protein
MDAPSLEACSGCGQPLLPTDPRPVLRSTDARYHLTCAPIGVLESAEEEYQAILRKGVRYFVEKYEGSLDLKSDIGTRFLELGRALEQEHERRAKALGRPAPGQPPS